jgi:ABC-type glycerol-3-phosphate transport system permease component
MTAEIVERRHVRHPMRRTLLYALAIGTSLLMIAPLYWMFATSFKPTADIFASPPKWIPSPWTLSNYNDILRTSTDLTFDRYFVNSVIVTAAIVSLNALFDTMAAYAFAKLRFPGRDVIFFLLLITLMIPFQVNLIPLYRLMVFFRNINPHLGIDSYAALIMPSMIQVFGIFLMRQFFQSIPDEVLESARCDGASEFRIIWSVALPLALPGIATLAIFTFLSAWNDFLWPLLVTSSNLHRTLPVGVALTARRNTTNWGDTMAGTVLAAFPMIIVFLVLQRRFIEGLTAGAVKG